MKIIILNCILYVKVQISKQREFKSNQSLRLTQSDKAKKDGGSDRSGNRQFRSAPTSDLAATDGAVSSSACI